MIRDRATAEQVEEMLEVYGIYIKIAVDVDRSILAGGGELHADCEKISLENGSRQANIWGADWVPLLQKMQYESMINLRPRQNRSMEILDPKIREKVAQITQQLLGEL